MGLDGISAGLMAKVANPDGTINMEKLQEVAKNSADEFSAEANEVLKSGLNGGIAESEGPGDKLTFKSWLKNSVSLDLKNLKMSEEEIAAEKKAAALMADYERSVKSDIAKVKKDDYGKAYGMAVEYLRNKNAKAIEFRDQAYAEKGLVATHVSDASTAGVFVVAGILVAAALFVASCDTADKYEIYENLPNENVTINVNTNIYNNITLTLKNNETVQNNAELSAKLDRLIALHEEGNDIARNNGDTLNKILAKLDAIDKRQQESDAVKVELLNQILDKIVALEEGQKDMSAAAKAFYDTLLAKIDNMSEAQANFYVSLIAKMDDMSDVAIQKILDKMDVINSNVENMKAADAEFYAALLAKMDTLGDKADTIIAKFEGLVFPDGGQPVDLTKVEDLMKQILDAVKANGDKLDVNNEKLDAIYEKIDAIPGKLDAIQEKLNTLSNAPDYTALLQEIRDKIKPCEGHECDHTGIIDALLDIKILVEQIKDKIKEDTNDPHHEGILDDLDDIFG